MKSVSTFEAITKYIATTKAFRVSPLFVCIILVGLITVTQSKADDHVQKIDSLLNALHKKGVFNGNILVAEKGKILYKNSFGYADETKKIPLNENSVFELASCSKQFTAMAIMILKERGKLKFEDKVSQYIPELSYAGDITINHLIHHTGGLPDYMGLLDSLFDKKKIATNKDIIELLGKHKPPVVFAPNTKFEYSNTGYALLASIIEKASGTSYAKFLKTEIFDPLGMKHTLVYNRRYAPKKIDNYAYGYVYNDSTQQYLLPDNYEPTKMVVWLDGIVGDGCVNSTANDLFLWDRALHNKKLISEKGYLELFSESILPDSTSTKYAFGWTVDTHPTFGKVIAHNGGWPGYVSRIERHPESDKTIILLQNHHNVTIPHKDIRHILYNIPLAKIKERKEINLPIEKLQNLVGKYAITPEMSITISLNKEQLYAQMTGQGAIPIYPESDLFFFLKVVDAQIMFEMNGNNNITRLYLLQNQQKIEAQKVIE